MNNSKSVIIKVYRVKPWYRELWSNASSFAVIVGFFAVGWWLDSSAMQWFAFVCAFLWMFGKSTHSIKNMSAQETADFLRDEYGVVSPKRTEEGNE